MSKETQQIFKLQLQFKKQQSKRKLKTRKQSKWIIPTAYYRQMRKIIKVIMDKYINQTLSLFPLLEKWDKEIKQLKDDKNGSYYELDTLKIYAKDAFEEELESINENEYENIFNEEKDFLKRTLLSTGVLLSAFNLKQWQKVTKQGVGIDNFTYENWEKTFLNTWVNRNVNLIKGLTEEYRKKIMDTIIDSYQKGTTLDDIKTNLRKINKTFSESRVNLIAKDQVNKINSQLAEQRQKDAGVETYIWQTARDERVRKTHIAMQGKLCRWDDATVYSNDNGKTWLSRSSIGGVLLHPGQDYNCRCIAEPNFEPLITEVNNTKEVEEL